jgi:ABC-2 type transport system ATP-binding protein
MLGVETTAAVRASGLRVRRGGREVLHSLDFSIPTGSLTALIGPSGCGKSTLLRAIVGVQVITAGSIEVLGAAAGSPGLRRRLGYATQAPAVYADLSVGANLRYFAAVLGAGREDARRVIGEVGLENARDHVVGRLSGGQLMRVSLAVALLGTPELLVLDEPTVGLDPVLREELWSLFNDTCARGVTMIISSHVMEEASRCQRLLLMRDGRILSDDTPEGLRHQTGAADLDQAFLRLVQESEAPAAP